MASLAVALCLVATLLPGAPAATLRSASQESGSPVQKVIELLEDNKVKVANDLAAEEKEMAEYADFCSKEASEKGYAIKTGASKIEDLSATIEECTAKIPGYEDSVSTNGNLVAQKEKELSEAAAVRAKESKDFQATEADLSTSITQLEKAAAILKKATGGSFMQTDSQTKSVKLAVKIIGKVIESSRVNLQTGASLQALLQTGSFDEQGEEEYEGIGQPQAKQVAYESKSGGIVQKVEEMKEEAEETLTAARDAEMKAANDFAMLELSLNNGIKIANDKISEGKAAAGAKTEEMETAKGEKVEAQKAKAADEEYLSTLKKECEESAAGWEARQQSAKAEMGAIDKAISILSEGVRVFLQVSSRTQVRRVADLQQTDAEMGEEDGSSSNRVRSNLVQKLKDMSHQFGSNVFLEMAGAATSDPFVKIRGLIEEMIAKLVQEAQEEATQKAFCDAEMGKSKKAISTKTLKTEKLQARVDEGSSRKAKLEENVKQLEAEIADLDKATAEATKIRNEEHTSYMKAAKDFGDAAAAVEKAIKVLKDFYDNQSFFFLQTRSEEDADDESDSDAPAFGGAKSDAASVIIGILEMSGEDFTKLLMEVETTEQTADEAYQKLMTDNKVSKAAKSAEAKASLSEIKSLSVNLKDTTGDLDSLGKELDAVNAYVQELKPQCEEKTMSYAEKKQRREAEIAGLKDALSILSGA